MMCDSSLEPVEIRTDSGYSYQNHHGTTSPMEIVDVMSGFGAEALPIYTPMSLQPLFRGCNLMTLDGIKTITGNIDDSDSMFRPMSREAWLKGVCLPGNPNMTEDEICKCAEVVRACFNELRQGEQ